MTMTSATRLACRPTVCESSVPKLAEGSASYSISRSAPPDDRCALGLRIGQNPVRCHGLRLQLPQFRQRLVIIVCLGAGAELIEGFVHRSQHPPLPLLTSFTREWAGAGRGPPSARGGR